MYIAFQYYIIYFKYYISNILLFQVTYYFILFYNHCKNFIILNRIYPFCPLCYFVLDFSFRNSAPLSQLGFLWRPSIPRRISLRSLDLLSSLSRPLYHTWKMPMYPEGHYFISSALLPVCGKQTSLMCLVCRRVSVVGVYILCGWVLPEIPVQQSYPHVPTEVLLVSPHLHM